MKNMANNTNYDDELREEYHFSELKDGIRGKYADKYQAGTNLVLLEPDVAAAFPTNESVNEALRLLMKIAKQTQTNAL